MRPAGGTLSAVVGDPAVPAVGDWLHLDASGVRIGPRTSELARDGVDRTSRQQVIAANIDAVMLVEPLEPEPAVGRLERLLTITHRCGARPVVVLTKADLVRDADYWAERVGSLAPGAGVHTVSATTGSGMPALIESLQTAHTLALLGPSGAGKSTLVNALAGAEVMATGVARGDGRGMHTTTHRELVMLPTGQMLIDTPGLRSIGLVATAEAVAATFTDITDLARACRFNDCGHDSEPGCGVQRALAQGHLDERRLESWRKLQREAEHQAARADARLASEQRKKWKRATRASRAARGAARR